MLIAIFSDVHGNLAALEAVLADIKEQAPDLVYFAGDLCLFGSRPAACLERLQQEKIISIYGNKDLPLRDPPPVPNKFGLDVAPQDTQEEIRDIVDWTRDQLDDKQRAWLTALPFYHRVSPTTHPKDDLFIVHANPKDIEQHIYPAEAKQKEVYGEVRQPDDDVDLHHMLRGLSCDLLAFGHVHIPNIRHWQDKVLINISSVSLPQDGDQRAKYGLLNWDAVNGWRIKHRYVAYDVDEEITSLGEKKLPGWESYQRRLETARPLQKVYNK
jgi:predicted phosphodiesterase